MIRYYAYYNHGGYKDFYLGSEVEEVDFKYFLPLLNVHEQILKDNYNEELSNNVERQKQLPKLIPLSDVTIDYNYPSEARIMMSHSGYKLLYRKIKEKIVLAIRDILGKTDSYGRQSPFNIMIIGDSEEDIKSLDSIAEYIRCNIINFEEQICSYFVNDFVENGLKFNFKAFNSYIHDLISKCCVLQIKDILNLPIRMLIIPSSTKIGKALSEQSITPNEISLCYNIDGIMLHKAEKEHLSLNPSVNIERNPRSSESYRESEQDMPFIHEMFNVHKREEIKKLWDYIYKLEKRIEKLENRNNYE